ncbi:MAG: ABC transporter ATP-binding protein [Candidatus Sumerlaeaceae bacterium]|nr:ABC transporter ATP-binding protein [Candidatus Sumerlaeaceae bacterium]
MTTTYAIETLGLGRMFGGRWAVADLHLQVPRGCVYGFLGLNGAGKSTTMRMLMGLLQPTSGYSSVLGMNPAVTDLEVKRRVGYVADSPNFYEWMTVREICAFVAHYRKAEWDDTRANKLLDSFELPRNQKLKTLSKGQRSKVSLALALGFNPELLLLDEPTGGLDPIARRQFIEGVLAEYMEGDRTILISSHLINEISGLVDYVGIIRDGQLIRSEPADKLLGGLRRVKLHYDIPAPGAYACTGLLHSRTDGREAQLIVDDFDPERTPAEIQHLGASQVEIETLSLEDAFIELAGKAPQS